MAIRAIGIIAPIKVVKDMEYHKNSFPFWLSQNFSNLPRIVIRVGEPCLLSKDFELNIPCSFFSEAIYYEGMGKQVSLMTFYHKNAANQSELLMT